MQVVVIATRWGAFEGGINAFNQPFTEALAAVGHGHIGVVCAVTTADRSTQVKARRAGVTLLEIGPSAEERSDAAGRLIVDLLRAQGLSTEVTLWVGHDIKTGFAATAAAARFGGQAALIHHMRYAAYRNLGGGKGSDTAAKEDQQHDLFENSAALLFGVGEYLRESVAWFGARNAYCIVPGFPSPFEKNVAGDDPLRIVIAGRFDADGEPLKQSKLVAAGLGRAIRQAGPEVGTLMQAELNVFGASDAMIAGAELERLVQREAGRSMAVIPRSFDAERGILRHLVRANLAVMPSVREGFGLVGWEAIGCEVPLIVGADTGLVSFLNKAFDNHADRYVVPIELSGETLNEGDVERMAAAIRSIAKDVFGARERAATLRAKLVDRFKGCTWPAAAETFLADCGIPVATWPTALARTAGVQTGGSGVKPGPFDVTVNNYREECAEIELDEDLNQGSNDRLFDVMPTLWFGETEVAIGDGTSVAVGVARAHVRVTSESGRLVGERLGEGARSPPGIVPNAGGVWLLTNPNGGILGSKVLGAEPLCRVETPPNFAAHAKVEVTAARRDLRCDFRSDADVNRTTQSVMEIFLANAIFQHESGRLVLCEAEMRKEP